MERIIQVLRRFNYTETEAKVYMALLQNGIQTGYEVSKSSGVPRSKVYNALEMLVSRGVVVTTAGNKTILYRAESIDRLSSLIQASVDEGIQELQQEAEKYTHAVDDEQIWKMSGYQCILDKCKEMIRSSEKNLMIQIWQEELTDEIDQLLLEKEQDIKLLVILYDEKEQYRTGLKHVYKHGFENDKLQETGCRWLTVVADEKEMLHASIRNSAVADAAYTKNASMVFFAKEYVQHDAYAIRMIDLIGEQVRERFGEDMEGVRDVFAIH
ncbi:MAG: hypothetical protein K0R19_1732 [Bacillota bacterium]|jgi:sugar-specific transcriptional regulator TrmB|nr:hypothetical protein [Bacillota bacterium]